MTEQMMPALIAGSALFSSFVCRIVQFQISNFFAPSFALWTSCPLEVKLP